MAPPEASSTANTSRVCEVCKKEFPNGKSWGGHIRACYKKRDQMNLSSATAHSRPPQSSSSTASRTQSPSLNDDLVESLRPGWTKRTKLSSHPTPTPTPTPVPVELSPEEREETILNLLSFSFEACRGKAKAPENIKLAMAEVEKYERRRLAGKAPDLKESDTASSLRIREKKKRSFDEIEEQQQPIKYYVCSECGEAFDNFRALGGHRSSHSRKKAMAVVELASASTTALAPAPVEGEEELAVVSAGGSSSVPSESDHGTSSSEEDDSLPRPETLVVDDGQAKPLGFDLNIPYTDEDVTD
ncbi:hypothetical protein Tsubulata_001951 [Turnera subulata]|uniref:C2H2-type domain-containing protein n=1 Tax=Turnera subulata TaxID=218843 RepID=A0A9Q0F9T2_9ROSI|nr:hypothetical protein Tsubulata_001951 [Turnera subulata]